MTVSGATWKLVKASPWLGSEPIHVKEVRGTLFGLRRAVKDVRQHSCRKLFLSDNLGMTFALEKGRATDPRVLRVCQRWCALTLACNIIPRVRWLPSEFNPSDKDSRRWEHLSPPAHSFPARHASAR